ncbi:hypothetical protein JRI60_12330 [Archangium violaceum]|uniref:hypothetical protein n=1 Tax=Archangium violaceum TaxID=83451 RepID=UPI00195039B9|nr:hypothetical protein [Archangium violaceum]QRN99748.1 hypothetical protein JRI60_12330 [Archangium violaceum]
MREDMFKVIVERPRMRIPKRNGSHYPRGRLKRTRGDLEEAPKREAMGRGYAYKCFNENLAPLRRFLHSRVGRPWNDVYSEICAHVSLDSAIKKHILEHLEDFVVRQVQEIDGRIYKVGPYGRPIELESGSRWDRLYVCPRTGLLRAYEREPWEAKFPGRALDEWHDVRKIDGGWCLVRFAPVPSSFEERQSAYDVVLRKHVYRATGRNGALKTTWGRQDRYACMMRRLGEREYQRLLGG